MTDKEKLKEIKKLADAMYYAAQYLTTDASRLHKAMDEYRQFIIHEWREEPVSDVLNTESMIESYRQRLISQANGMKNSPLIDMCLVSYKHGINETLDTLKLSNIERTVKNWKEPVSEDLKTELNKYIKDHFTVDKEQLDRFGIEEKDYMYSMDKSDMLALVEHFTNWQKTKEEIACEDLENAAIKYAQDKYMPVQTSQAFKAGAEWQIAKLMANATEVTVHIEAGNYPYIPQMELYDYDKDIPLAKEGDKYKVILIKED